ncbi:hypothetical protein DWF00_24815 [Bosea caraganae]|uniref:Uncharacterized protein n=1 Tax=Bosea caraganae TaxID=2763117 RepID=A0A370L0J5_9HYPH|nr:hypothetical protein DWE98_22810 [Bosea caraganae]RDJ21588.1 hypothetical protein DWF00_24815 [Bosea caraganae]
MTLALTLKSLRRHCEERSDEAIQGPHALPLDCFAALAMTAETPQDEVQVNRGVLRCPPTLPI